MCIRDSGGPALGRNLGVMKSKYEIIIFIDSDLIVLDDFIVCHVNKLLFSWNKNNKKCFTYGSVINTSNFSKPESERYKLTDFPLHTLLLEMLLFQKNYF